MAKKLTVIIVGLLTIVAMVLPGCTGGGTEGIPYKNPGQFIQQTFGTVDSLDPAWGYDAMSGEQVLYIYETLLFWDGTHSDQFVPKLATEWSFNETTLEYRFHIQSGVTFHEGGTLSPDDVEYSFERAMVQDRVGGPIWMLFQPLLGVYHSTNFTEIDAAVEVDGEWVVFTLFDAAWQVPFLQILCGAWASIVDKEWCITQGAWPGTEETALDPAYHQPAHGTTALHDETNGTGPWKLNLWEPGEQIKLEKFDGYWGDPAPFDWVITKTVEEWTNRKLALLAGEADYVDVPRQYIGELEDVTDLIKYQDLPDLQNICMFYTFNISDESPYLGSGTLDGEGIPPDFFSDPDVRLGLAYAFDYVTFVNDAYLGEATRTGGPLVDGLLGFDPDRPMYNLNLTLAEDHLRAAWNGTLWDTGFKFTIFYNVGNEQRQTAANILASQLADLNEKFQVSTQPVQWSNFVNGFVAHLYPIFVIGWTADYPDPDDFITPYMHRYGDFAYSQCYGSPTIDALVEAARYETDPETRAGLYSDLEDIYYDDVPGIMLCQPLGRRFFTKYISGFYFNPMHFGDPGPLWDMSKSES